MKNFVVNFSLKQMEEFTWNGKVNEHASTAGESTSHSERMKLDGKVNKRIRYIAKINYLSEFYCTPIVFFMKV